MRIYDSAGLVKISASNIPIAANPSGLIGLAAVNGSALTFERSDSTHALDQGIAPTWTAAHIFSAATGTAVTVNATSGNPGVTIVGAAGAGTSFGQFIQAGANASDYALRANLKSGLNSLNLAGDGSITFGNTTSSGGYTFNGTGTVSIGGPINASVSNTGYISHNYTNTNGGVSAGVQTEYLNNLTAAMAIGIASSNSTSPVWTNGPNYAGFIGTTANISVSIATNNVERLRIASNGATTINTPVAGGVALQVNGVANQNAVQIAGATTPSGQSYGMDILGGTTSADWAINIRNASAASMFQIRGDGLARIGVSGSAVQPFTDNATTLGVGGARWTTVFATTGTINTSDAREKKDIALSDLGLGFILKLRPVSYKWKDPTHTGNGTHYGLIAQEVKQLIGGKAFAGWREDDPEDPASRQGLNYSEFIAPLIRAIQEQQVRIDALERHCYPKLDFAA